ncbi:nitrate- and nitrite sensing domain-containing protein [Krasilnikovia sp. MM14-A1004]|uniref:sensor histidine kinase n=1 Tax=Krasilnikovia sp. MM14-A1004 TaxID=3373541 RepID=UPI00399C9491
MPSPLRRLWASTGWPDWANPARTLAVLVVPVLVAIVAGSGAVRQAAAQDAAAREDARLADAAARLSETLAAVQRERAAVAHGTPGVSQARRLTDASFARLASEQHVRAGGVALADAADRQMTRLVAAREVAAPSRAVADYSTITTGLYGLLAALPGTARDARLSQQLTGVTLLARAGEDLDLARILIGSGSPDAGPALARYTGGIAQFRTLAPADAAALYAASGPGAAGSTLDRLSNALLAAAPPRSTGGVQAWQDAVPPVLSGLDRAAGRILDDAGTAAHRRATAAAADRRDRTVALGLAALLSVAIGALLTTQARRSARHLRVATTDLAHQHLPTNLGQLRDGRAVEAGPALLPAMPREFRGVAAAFDAISREAVQSAVAQRAMRAGYAEVFTNMFRRSQTLVQRQLLLMERLESREQAPEQLALLFQLDHLIARMRRNNENVLILSGTELVRVPAKPTSVGAIIQAAMSEVENYRRVDVVDPPRAKVTDSAAGDLIRLLAELIDNATSFSPPETRVAVQAQTLRDGSLSIAVVDEGIGMSDAEVLEANTQLTRLGSTELARSKRVGLLVAGRLAGRHGFGVELLGGDQFTGVTAVVSVPADLVVDAERPGWADRRLALEAAAKRRKHKTAERQPTAGPAGTRTPEELVEAAHADVPTDLPTRVPNRVIGRSADRTARVASGWFAARRTAGEARSVTSGVDEPEAGDGWSVLTDLRRPREYAYTDDGLPIREAGSHLLPGNARPAPGTAGEPARRDPSRARLRLSSFQRGVRRAKGGDGGAPRLRSAWKSLTADSTAGDPRPETE